MLRRWLRSVVVRLPRLVAYVDWLRAEVATFSCLELPPEDVVSNIVRAGLKGLQRHWLVWLALNPVALFHLHDRIREEKPAWLRRRRSPAVLPLVLGLKTGKARQVGAAADDASGYAVFSSQLHLSIAGRTYKGQLRWNWKATETTNECYLRAELLGVGDSPLATQSKAPTLVVHAQVTGPTSVGGPRPGGKRFHWPGIGSRERWFPPGV